MNEWTAAAEVRAAVMREWETGRLLAGRVPLAGGAGVGSRAGTAFPFRVRLRGPKAREMADRFDEV